MNQLLAMFERGAGGTSSEPNRGFLIHETISEMLRTPVKRKSLPSFQERQKVGKTEYLQKTHPLLPENREHRAEILNQSEGHLHREQLAEEVKKLAEIVSSGACGDNSSEERGGVSSRNHSGTGDGFCS